MQLTIPVRPTVRHRSHDRGSAYVMVLVVSMIVTVIGVSVIRLGRIQNRQSVRANDWVEAQIIALSGAEQAMSALNADQTWRTLYAHGVTAQTHNLGRGRYQWTLFDTVDGDLTDSVTDAITVEVAAIVGDATYRLSVDVSPTASATTIVNGSWIQVVD